MSKKKHFAPVHVLPKQKSLELPSKIHSYPAGAVHVNEPNVLEHVDRPGQMFSALFEHSSMSTKLQPLPRHLLLEQVLESDLQLNPGSAAHTKPDSTFWQRELMGHLWLPLAHSSKSVNVHAWRAFAQDWSVTQPSPEHINPESASHWKLPSLLLQNEFVGQGEVSVSAHSSMSWNVQPLPASVQDSSVKQPIPEHINPGLASHWKLPSVLLQRELIGQTTLSVEAHSSKSTKSQLLSEHLLSEHVLGGAPCLHWYPVLAAHWKLGSKFSQREFKG